MRDEQGHAYKNLGGRAHSMGCYRASGWLFFRTGYMERVKDALQMIGKFMSFLMIIWVWDVIWSMVPLDILSKGLYDQANLVWYISITEAIIFCGGYLFYDTYVDIKTGAIEQQLVRPVSYQFRMMLLWYGRALGQMTLFYPLALLSAFVVTGVWVPSIVQIAQSLIMILGSLFCVVCLNYVVACMTLWIKEAAPAYWISQKLCFLLGGLLFPLTLYPAVFYKVTQFLPFIAVFFMSGSTMLNVLPFDFAVMVAIQLFWMGALLGFSLIINKLAVRRVGLYGAA